MSDPLTIAGRSIGSGKPCFVIAEAGVNHNGDAALAHKLIDVAAGAGADAVKFQTFIPEKLASAGAPKAAYQVENTGPGGSQLEMLRALSLPQDAYPELMAHAQQRGLIFFSTPFDEESADLLHRLGVPVFKLSSGDLDNLPLIAHIAKKKLPMLLSTGMSTLQEIAPAAEAVKSHGAQLGLFHCVTNYPTAAEDCNLKAIDSIRERFGVPTGWSDHTQGIDISIAAVALGAEMLEKHFTLDRSMRGPDHKASLEPEELRELVSAVRRVEAAKGDGIKQPREVERAIRTAARKSLHWGSSLPAGAVVTEDDLTSLRPGSGISPARMQEFIGRRLGIAVKAGEQLGEEDFVAGS